jgi:TnpA family transposase
LLSICHVRGFRFAPFIRELKDKRLYTIPGMAVPSVLEPPVAGQVNLKSISNYREDILRLAASIKTGTVPASESLRKLASYSVQNGLALALREVDKPPAQSGLA